MNTDQEIKSPEEIIIEVDKAFRLRNLGMYETLLFVGGEILGRFLAPNEMEIILDGNKIRE